MVTRVQRTSELGVRMFTIELLAAGTRSFSLLFAREITASGAHLKVLVARCVCDYLHVAVYLVGEWVGGFVSDAVLVPYIARDLAADVVNFFKISWEERHTSSLNGERFQSPLGPSLLSFFPENTNGVYGWTAVVLHGADGLFQRHSTFVVFTVCDHQQNFFLPLGALGQMVGCGIHRVVQRGTAARVHPFKCLPHLRYVICKILVQEWFIVEVHDENFIVGIAGLHQVDHCLGYGISLGPHGP